MAAEKLLSYFTNNATDPKFWFCVNSPSLCQKRVLADKISLMGWEVEWCIKAIDEVGRDEQMEDRVEQRAVDWLLKNAPSLSGK